MVFFFIPFIILAVSAFGLAVGITMTFGTEGWLFSVAVVGTVAGVGMLGWLIKITYVRVLMAIWISIFLGTILSPFGQWLRNLVGGG